MILEKMTEAGARLPTSTTPAPPPWLPPYMVLSRTTTLLSQEPMKDRATSSAMIVLCVTDTIGRDPKAGPKLRVPRSSCSLQYPLPWIVHPVMRMESAATHETANSDGPILASRSSTQEGRSSIGDGATVTSSHSEDCMIVLPQRIVKSPMIRHSFTSVRVPPGLRPVSRPCSTWQCELPTV